MSVNLNQFGIGPAVGDADLSHSSGESIVSVRFGYGETAGDIEPGEGVMLSDLGANDTPGAPIVAIRTSEHTDPIYGVKIRNTKKAKVEGGDVFEIAKRGAVVRFAAAGAISRGAAVTLTLATPGQVKAVSTKTPLGIALDKASTAGDIIRVELTCDGIAVGTA
jgi:hypothetical protein